MKKKLQSALLDPPGQFTGNNFLFKGGPTDAPRSTDLVTATYSCQKQRALLTLRSTRQFSCTHSPSTYSTNPLHRTHVCFSAH